MFAARRSEIKNLLNRGTFKFILKEDIPPNEIILPVRFFSSIKSTSDGKIKHKANFVIGGHRDKFKKFMLHFSQT